MRVSPTVTKTRRAKELEQPGGDARTQAVFVDGHVHLYPGVRLASVFAALARRVGVGAEGRVVRAAVVLADPDGVDGFGRVARGEDVPDPWRIEDVGRRHVQFGQADGSGILFVRGRQLVTAEGLEVLAAGVGGELRSGQGLSRTLEDVRARGGWSTIAWGVGKWLGRRGRMVSDAVRAEAGSGDVVLGDNGGRPGFWRSVPQFDVAAENGMRVLPGTDPLPVRGDEARIGGYGFEIDLPQCRGEALAVSLAAALADRSVTVRVRGGRVGAARFVVNQLRIRLPRRREADARRR